MNYEHALINRLIVSPSSYIDAASILTSEMFSSDDAREIFSRIEKNESVSLEVLREVIGIESITKIGTTPPSNDVEGVAKIIRDRWLQRELVELQNTLTDNLFSTGSGEDTLNKLALHVERLQSGIATETNPHISSIIPEALDRVIKATQSKGLTGIETGFAEIDKVIGGWQSTDLITIAARPGMGKTSFAIYTSLHAANQGKSVGIISREMARSQLFYRMLSNATDIPVNEIRQGKVNDLTRITNESEKLGELPIYMDDRLSDIRDIKIWARRIKQKYELDLLVVDYIQLVRAKVDGNREREVSTISGMMKDLAKELSIPVIGLAQLNRACEARPNKLPQLADLRESGSIEQDSDLVAMMWRGEYYNYTEDENGESTDGVVRFMIKKHRHGALGDIKLGFRNGNFMQYKRPLTYEAVEAPF